MELLKVIYRDAKSLLQIFPTDVHDNPFFSQGPLDNEDCVSLEAHGGSMTNDLLPTRHFHSLHQQANSYWWPRTRLAVVYALLKKCRIERPALLDLGCGAGEFLESISSHFSAKRAVGVDMSPTALQYLKKSGLEYVEADLNEPLVVQSNGFHLVVSMDVLEHLSCPRALVQTAWQNLAPGGFFIANVPAHPSLFSDHDRMLHHVCRFSRHALKTLILTQPFAIRRLSYSFFAAMFGAWTVRKMHFGNSVPTEEYPSIPNWLNNLLVLEGKLEAAWLRCFDFPTGLSLTVLAQKPIDSDR